MIPSASSALTTASVCFIPIVTGSCRISSKNPKRQRRKSFARKLQAHLAVALGVVAPAFAHLDEQEQVDGRLEHLRDLAPRLRADRLDGRPTLAQHDLALALALDIDRLLDPGRA